MNEVKELICITCPKGCEAKVWKEEDSIRIKGKICKKGRGYIRQEFLEPRRILTSTAVVENSRVRRLPVRTVSAIAKRDLAGSMAHLSKIRVSPPVMIGDVIIPDISNTGVDLIASDDVLE